MDTDPEDANEGAGLDPEALRNTMMPAGVAGMPMRFNMACVMQNQQIHASGRHSAPTVPTGGLPASAMQFPGFAPQVHTFNPPAQTPEEKKKDQKRVKAQSQ